MMQYLQDTTEGRQSPPKALQSPTPAAITSGMRHCVSVLKASTRFLFASLRNRFTFFPHTAPTPHVCNEGKRFFFQSHLRHILP